LLIFVLEAQDESLADLSSFTKVQVDTLKIHLAERKGEINMIDALKRRKSSGISRGTYYRILAQAKKNLRESLLTVAVAAQMGVIKPEDVQKLIAMVSMIPEQVDPEKLPEVLVLVKAVADRIVML
jgi:hypothetical protein